MMVEAGASEVPEDAVIEAMEIAMEANSAINALIEEIAAAAAPVKKDYTPAVANEEAIEAVRKPCRPHRGPRFERRQRAQRGEQALRAELVEQFEGRFEPRAVADALYAVIKKAMRDRILNEGRRADDRETSEIRPLDIHVGTLPRTHGSGLFKRGETQVLTIATLGGMNMAQKLDTLSPDESKRYMHHYNFPPYSVGEARPMRGAGRREIGHGALAERALLPVIPPETEFPYALRLVSEVLSSNGSTSMASVCGSTLALMDAGVPLSAPVAGIAMGLIMGEDDNYAVLTDIAGQEDFMGDMDFKVAGTDEGITALQMDIKIGGVSRELLETALAQAREARVFLLERMADVIDRPRETVSEHAPKVSIIKIDQEKTRHRHRPRRPRHPQDPGRLRRRQHRHPGRRHHLRLRRGGRRRRCRHPHDRRPHQGDQRRRDLYRSRHPHPQLRRLRRDPSRQGWPRAHLRAQRGAC